MYDCPNCGGNLRFDIPLQQLHCDFCGTSMDPYSYEKERDAVENDVYETTVYTCPQCGGEIMTTNVSATGFCMYCGASTILDSRIRREKRPARIIPFRKTKEDCKKAFTAMMSRSLYAPKALKSPEYLEKFRGIYIPYWMYDFSFKGIHGLHGSTTSRKGDYRITKHYDLSCDMDTVYSGVSYDASSSLDDSLSECIAPFDPDGAKDFTPSFLCGFYADTADVPADTYTEDALSLVADDIIDRAKKEIFPGQGAEKPDSPEKVLSYSSPRPVCALFPVWFLTYRHGNRVAYSVMNGQTGKISSDLPIVEWKYLVGSILFAFPLFLLFNAVLTVTAPTALFLTMIPAAASGYAFLAEIRAQRSLESHEGDKGYQAINRQAVKQPKESGPEGSSKGIADGSAKGGSADSAYSAPESSSADSDNASAESSSADIDNGRPEDGSQSAPADGQAGREKSGQQKKKTSKKKGGSTASSTIWIIAVIAFIVSYSAGSSSGILEKIMKLAPVAAATWIFLSAMKLQKEFSPEKSGVFPGIAGANAALIIGELVLLLHPVSDLYYYGAGIISILCTCLTLFAVVRRYNFMATRPLPSFFDRKGGDDLA